MDPSAYFRFLNFRGLQNNKGRLNSFHWLKQKVNGACPGVNIISETHCAKKNISTWSKQWSTREDNSLWSPGKTNKKGVAILINDDFRRAHPSLKISHVKIDPHGRYIKCIMSFDNLNFRILGVYAPNNPLERVAFFGSLYGILDDGIEAENVYGGDWNCALNPLIDRYNCVKPNDLGNYDLSLLCDILDIEDIWRRRNPEKREYSWSGRGKRSRIDFCLASISLNSQIKNIFYSVAPYTDHCAVNVIIDLNEAKRGPGIWKMNTQHLLNPKYKERLTELWEKWRSKKNEYADIKRWWDLGKRHIKSFSISFAKEMSMQTNAQLRELEEKIDLRKKANADYDRLLKEYEDLFSLKANGARIRSRLQDFEEGEKSSKYFYGLEKKNAKEKAWTEIFDKHGNTITGTSNIQRRQLEFYEDLFRTQNLKNDEKDYNFFFDNLDKSKKLSEDSKNFMDSDIEASEIFKALKKMQNNKSPGPGGICVEFYKLYWNLIGDDLCEVLKKGLEDQELAYSQYLASIILLYKKGPRPDIKNWRPISLLNCDYKLLSKVLAERLKRVLTEIISNDQRGCVPGRYIGENIRLVEDMIYEIEQGNIPAVLLQLDQEKAFDRVEWDWLFKVLVHFNFGETFISHLKTLYKNARSCIITNGYQSRYFDVSRGIRQGDSLSALLFIIQFEPLLAKIKAEKDIKGISVYLRNSNDTIETKGCQYVDDTNSFISDIESTKKYFELIGKFEKLSGSKVNIDKTVCMPLNGGNMLEAELKVLKLKLSTGPEKALGVPIGKSTYNYDTYWEGLIEKVEKKLKVWRSRSMSYEGKTLLIRSVGASQILYAAEMKVVDQLHVKKINEILFEFLWAGKNIKINREICYLPRDLGGIGMVDLDKVIKVKRVNWIIRFLKEGSGQSWSRLIENYIRCLDNSFDIEFFSLKVTDSSDLIKAAKIPAFYKECILSFQELLRIGRVSQKNDIIWCNHEIVFLNKPLCFNSWSKSGIKTTSDLYTQQQLNSVAIRRKLTSNFAAFIFQMAKIRRVMPRQMENILPNNDLLLGGKEELLQMQINIPDIGTKAVSDLTSKDIYRAFLLNKIPELPSEQYWKEKFNINEIDWNTWFKINSINVFLPRKVKDFNWRLTNGLVNFNSKLRHMKHKDKTNFSDGNCEVCKRGLLENGIHCIYECPNSAQIWKNVEQVISYAENSIITITGLHALTGFWEDGASERILLRSTIVGITRYHLWKIRCSIKFDNKLIDLNGSRNILRTTLINHIKILLSLHKENETVCAYLRKLKQGIDERNLL